MSARLASRDELERILTLDAWVTSDQHWGHSNIGKYQDRPDDHMSLMRLRWIDLVGADDVVLCLGDLVCFGDRELHAGYIDGLPGRKYLLLGNHDKHGPSWYEENGFTVIGRRPMLWAAPDDTIVCFSHEPAHDDGSWEINVHGHTHSIEHRPSATRPEVRRNVCVEVTGYAPVRLGTVLSG